MYKRLLVPLDRSPFSEAALPYARALGRQFGSELVLVSVLEPLSPAAAEWAPHMSEMVLEMRNTAHRRTEAYLQALRGELTAEGFSVETHVVEQAGVVQALLELTQARSVDTIVMTTHGRTGLRRWMLGSVAERLVRQSRVPVLLVRLDDAAVSAAERRAAATNAPAA